MKPDIQSRFASGKTCFALSVVENVQVVCHISCWCQKNEVPDVVVEERLLEPDPRSAMAEGEVEPVGTLVLQRAIADFKCEVSRMWPVVIQLFQCRRPERCCRVRDKRATFPKVHMNACSRREPVESAGKRPFRRIPHVIESSSKLKPRTANAQFFENKRRDSFLICR